VKLAAKPATTARRRASLLTTRMIQDGDGEDSSSHNDDRNDRNDRGGRFDRNDRHGRGRDRNRDRNRDRGGREEREPVISEDDVLVPVGGLLDILESYAFIRTGGYLQDQMMSTCHCSRCVKMVCAKEML